VELVVAAVEAAAEALPLSTGEEVMGEEAEAGEKREAVLEWWGAVSTEAEVGDQKKRDKERAMKQADWTFIPGWAGWGRAAGMGSGFDLVTGPLCVDVTDMLRGRLSADGSKLLLLRTWGVPLKSMLLMAPAASMASQCSVRTSERGREVTAPHSHHPQERNEERSTRVLSPTHLCSVRVIDPIRGFGLERSEPQFCFSLRLVIRTNVRRQERQRKYLTFPRNCRSDPCRAGAVILQKPGGRGQQEQGSLGFCLLAYVLPT
jgi:hypothetical protein